MKDEVDFLPTDERQRSFYIDTIILGGYGQACPNYPEWQVYYLFSISSERTEWWSCFLLADKHERLIQIDSMLLMGFSSIPKVLKIAILQCLYNISKMKLDEIEFLHADKYRSFLQVDFNTLGIKVSYKVMLSLLMKTLKVLSSWHYRFWWKWSGQMGQACPKYPK